MHSTALPCIPYYHVLSCKGLRHCSVCFCKLLQADCERKLVSIGIMYNQACPHVSRDLQSAASAQSCSIHYCDCSTQHCVRSCGMLVLYVPVFIFCMAGICFFIWMCIRMNCSVLGFSDGIAFDGLCGPFLPYGTPSKVAGL